jgi:hypothetical protein
MDQCTFVQSARGAAGARPDGRRPQKFRQAREEIRPPLVGCSQNGLQEGRRPASRPSNSPHNSRSPTGSPNTSSKPTRPKTPLNDANRTAILAEAKPTLGALAPTRLVSCSRRPLTDFPLHRDRKFPTHDRSPITESRQPPCRASPDPYERRARWPAHIRQQAHAGADALLFNVKALTDQVKSLSDMVQHMSKTMRPGAAEDEARNQLH